MSKKVKSISNIKELNLALDISDGYMISVTLLEDQELRTFLLTKNFPKLDMLPSLKKTKNLIVDNLEEVELRENLIFEEKVPVEINTTNAEEAEFKEEEKDVKDS